MQALVVGADEARALVLGGFGLLGTRLVSHADVFSYGLMQREWAPLEAQRLPDGLSQFGVTEWQDALWVFGGMSFDAARERADQMRHPARVLRLDLSRPEARFEDAGVALREARRAFAGARLEHRYYLTGGLKENFEPTQGCEAIDLKRLVVHAIPCPSEHRVGGELMAIGRQLYLVGGSVPSAGGERSATPRVEVFDPERGSWSVLPVPVPLDSAEQLRAFAFQEQLLLYSAQRSDGRVQVALLDPRALAEGRQDYARMSVPVPPAPR